MTIRMRSDKAAQKTLGEIRWRIAANCERCDHAVDVIRENGATRLRCNHHRIYTVPHAICDDYCEADIPF